MRRYENYSDEEISLEPEGIFPDKYYETDNEKLRHKAHVRKLLEERLEKKRLKKELSELQDESFEDEFD